MIAIEVLLLALLAGSLIFCVLTVIGAWSYLAVKPAAGPDTIPISVLKPLAGTDEGLEQNLRSFFEQDYPCFELLFAVREDADPAAAVVRQLQREYPRVSARLLLTGEPPYPNAKVFSLDCMLSEARHDLLVMSDSDVRVTPDMLRLVAAEFRDEQLGLATCPYRAVPGDGFWSTLEAIGMNTEFLAGILVARLVEGMKFAVGPTIVARRSSLWSIGGFNRVKDYLAEDFVLGKFVAESGWRVILSSYVIEHRIGTQEFDSNARHRLRWARSTRRSRPSGYIGQIFTNPLPVALLLVAADVTLWPLLVLAMFMRALAALAVAGWVLHDGLTARRWYMVPLQDLVSFVFWLAGFFGNTIQWRGRTYRIRADGRFSLP